MLGLVTEDVSNPFYSTMARGVEEAVRDRDLLVVAGSSDEDPVRERALLELLCQQRVAGLLVVPTGSDHSFLASEIGHGTAVVFVDRPPGNLAADTVLLDNFGGAKSAVEHLLAHGHRRVGLIGDLPGIYTTAERLRGYEVALAGSGVCPDHELVRLGCHDSASAAAATLELMALADPPTALFACNNRICFGVLETLAGMSRPPALVGFDDFELASILSPPVSVVAYDSAEVGRCAARLVCERIDGADRPPRQSVIATRIVARGSGEVAAEQVAR
jgi:LacI family transcriptional regulator